MYICIFPACRLPLNHFNDPLSQPPLRQAVKKGSGGGLGLLSSKIRELQITVLASSKQTNEKNVLVISFFFFPLSDVAVFRLVFFKLIPCIACCGYCNPDLWLSFFLSLPKLSSVL